MSRGLNKVLLIGYLGRDPEMRFTPSGKSVANFPLACERTWKNTEGEFKTNIEWFNIVVWGELAEKIKKFLSKGSLAYIEGRLQTRTWQDKDGIQRKSIEVIARDVLLLNQERDSEETLEYQEGFEEDSL